VVRGSPQPTIIPPMFSTKTRSCAFKFMIFSPYRTYWAVRGVRQAPGGDVEHLLRAPAGAE
jgi:hypothetical protein